MQQQVDLVVDKRQLVSFRQEQSRLFAIAIQKRQRIAGQGCSLK